LSLLHPKKSAAADAFVLAGGRSSRMGQDKALISLAGKPLIYHALQILRDCGLQPCIAGAQSDFSALAPTLDAQILPDDPCTSSRGPLSGICTALAACTKDLAVFLPVDLSLIPPNLIAYLLHHAEVTQSAVTLISVSAFVQTFPVVIRSEALTHLQASLESDNRNCLRAFREASHTLSKPFSVLPGELLLQSGQVSHPGNFPVATWFLNLNTADDLTRAEALLAPTHFK
jgi:molybdopterin-guanine dinucleotide biosynthesis protein A